MEQELEISLWDRVSGPVVTSGRLLAENAHSIPPAVTGLLSPGLRRLAALPQLNFSFRKGGRDVNLHELDSLKSHAGGAAVFVHGLMADDAPWWKPGKERVAYGPALFRDKGLHPVYLRYDSGEHVSTNGRRLARALDDLCRFYPEATEELVLVGHSMGGLLVQSAGYYGMLEGHQWVRKVRNVVLLGTPNAGAVLEKISHVSSFVLDKFFHYWALAAREVLELRSDGIRDLRYGYIVDQDWQQDSGSFVVKRTKVPAIPGARYLIAAGTIAAESESVPGRMLGDGMIGVRSATRLRTSGAETRTLHQVFPGTSHVGLQWSPEILAWIEQNLA